MAFWASLIVPPIPHQGNLRGDCWINTFQEAASFLEGSSGSLTAVLEGLPQHGTLALNPNGAFPYTPTLDFHGVHSFTYHATDTISNSNVATVILTVEEEPIKTVYLPLVLRR